MDRSQQARALLAELAAELGLPDLAFRPDGVCAIAAEGGAVVELALDAAGRTLVLSSAVAPPPEGGEATLFRQLLLANALWRETDGLVMWFDAASGLVGQRRTLILEGLHLPALLAELDRFIRQREGWAAALAAPRDAAEPTPGSPPASAPGEQVIWL